MARDLRYVYTTHSLVGFAGSLIGIFIPAYLISLGYAAQDVFAYYLVYSVVVFAFFFVAAAIARYTGLRAVVMANAPFALGYVALLYALHSYHVPLLVIATVQGIGAGLYWFALHMFFIAGAEQRSMGASVGKLFGLPQAAGLVAPLVGGVLASIAGFPALMLAAGCVFVVAFIPLLRIPDLPLEAHFDMQMFLRFFTQWKRYTLVEFVENIREELEGIIWPLFIYLTFRNALSVGIVGSIAAVGSTLVTFAIGRYTDRINPKAFMRTGAVCLSAIWLIRYAWPHASILLYATTLAAGFLAYFIQIPFTSYIYSSAKRTHPTEFILYREFPVTVARVVTYTIALLLPDVTSLFLLGALASAIILAF